MSNSAPVPSNPAPGSTSTRSALERARSDPASGFAALLEKCESRLRVLLYFRLGSGAAARVDPDDVLQEVWAEAVRSLSRFEYRGPGSLQRWLAGILAKKLLHAKRAVERREAPLSAVLSGEGQRALFDALAVRRTSASRDARRRESEERVRRVLSDLPEPLRRAVLLRVYEGLSGREAADVEGVDESTMSLRLRDAFRISAMRLRGESV